MKFLAFFGTSLSFLDSVSDLFVVDDFYKTSRAGYSSVISANFVFQLILVTLHTSNLLRNKWTMLFEVLSG